MVTTLDDFSAYFFVPFLILGVWCLFEGDKFPLIEFFCPRDSNHMQEEKLAPSLLADRGTVDHGQGFNTHTTLHFPQTNSISGSRGVFPVTGGGHVPQKICQPG